MTVHLLDAHPGGRCRPARACLRRSLAAVAAGLWHWLRSGEFAGGPAPALPVSEGSVRAQWEQMRRERPELRLPSLRYCCRTTEDDAHADGCPPMGPIPAPRHAATQPRDLPAMLPRRLGDGMVVATPDGCEVVPRDAAPDRADQTMHDLPAVRTPRYLAEMPGGTNG